MSNEIEIIENDITDLRERNPSRAAQCARGNGG